MSADEMTLGVILRQMGLVTEAQIKAAIQSQRRQREGDLIGAYLMAHGLITKDQLEGAAQVQKDIRSGSRHKRALARARIAEVSHESTISCGRRARAAVDEVRRKTTGTGHPAVGPLLASPEES